MCSPVNFVIISKNTFLAEHLCTTASTIRVLIEKQDSKFLCLDFAFTSKHQIIDYYFHV